MRRREVLAGLCFTATLSRGQAQPLPNALSRIAFLTASVPTRTYLLEALRTGLRELGYVEGQSIAIETRYAGGRVDLLPGMAAELIAWKPHVIVAPETPAALAAKGATATLPIIFAIVGDPVSVGLIKDFAHPGGNATGLTTNSAELLGKRFDLLKEIVPAASKVGFPLTLDDASHPVALRLLEGAARIQRIAVQPYPFRGADELAEAFRRMRDDRIDALIVPGGALIAPHYPQIAELAARLRLPSISGDRVFPEAGGLLFYGAGYAGQMHRAATYVDKILKGVRPAELPVEQPTKFELVINLKAAKLLGLEIPVSLLVQAHEVVE